MPYDPARNYRRSIRLKGYDYGQVGAYFVTICVYNRECLFGEVRDGTVVPSPFGRLVDDCWSALARHFEDVELDVFVVMPNHVHGIIVIMDGSGEAFADRFKEDGCIVPANASPLRSPPSPPRGTHSGSLGAIIQTFKSVSARRIKRVCPSRNASLWQRNYYERIVRDEDELNDIRRYIIENPLRWELDENNLSRSCG